MREWIQLRLHLRIRVHPTAFLSHGEQPRPTTSQAPRESWDSTLSSFVPVQDDASVAPTLKPAACQATVRFRHVTGNSVLKLECLISSLSHSLSCSKLRRRSSPGPRLSRLRVRLGLPLVSTRRGPHCQLTSSDSPPSEVHVLKQNGCQPRAAARVSDLRRARTRNASLSLFKFMPAAARLLGAGVTGNVVRTPGRAGNLKCRGLRSGSGFQRPARGHGPRMV
eukprot:1109977-Rhodomonas_salina.1